MTMVCSECLELKPFRTLPIRLASSLATAFCSLVIHGCFSASDAVIRLEGLKVSILSIRSLAKNGAVFSIAQ